MFPKQRISYSDKIKNDFEWAKQSIDYLCQEKYTSYDKTKSSKARMLSNYRLFNNQIDQADFRRECNPLGLDVGQFQDVIHPYNKTYNKIQVLLSEELQRPFNYKAYLTDTEGVRLKLLHKQALLREYLLSKVQAFVQQVSSISPDLIEKDLKDILSPEQIEVHFKTSYQSRTEIMANKLLKYLTSLLSLRYIRSDGFKHGLIAGIEVALVSSDDYQPEVQVINPLNFFYHKSESAKYIQDSLFAGHYKFLTPSEVLDLYSEQLTSSEIASIEEFTIRPTSPLFSIPSFENQTNLLDVTHVTWRSQAKVGFLSFLNEYGDEQTDLVDENFEPPTYATKQKIQNRTYYSWDNYSLYWGWVPQVWEGTKIGHNIYVDIRPTKNQFRSKTNPNKVKLPYHGIIYSDTNAEPISLMDRMKPFQYLYFLVVHKLKKLIAQDQGQTLLFDTTMIDPELGQEKTLYYLKEFNIHFYNPLHSAESPGAMNRPAMTALDLSNMRQISSYLSILDNLDYQISDVAGVNKQREGQTSRTEAVTNAQQNILQSSLITEIYFQVHNKLWEQVLDSLLSTAITTYSKNPTPIQFILDEGSQEIIELSQEATLHEYGIFVTNSTKESELFENIKSLSTALLQANKASFSNLVELFKATSVEELSAKISQAEQEQASQLQQQQQFQQELQQQQQQFLQEQQDRKFQHELALAEIEVFKFQRKLDSDNNQVPDPLEIEKFKQKSLIDAEKLRLEEQRVIQTQK